MQFFLSPLPAWACLRQASASCQVGHSNGLERHRLCPVLSGGLSCIAAVTVWCGVVCCGGTSLACAGLLCMVLNICAVCGCYDRLLCDSGLRKGVSQFVAAAMQGHAIRCPMTDVSTCLNYMSCNLPNK